MATVPENKNAVKSKVSVVPAKKIATAAAKVSAEKTKTPKVPAVNVAATVSPVTPKAAPVVAAKPAAVGKVVNKTVNAPVVKSFVKPVVKPATKPETKPVIKPAIKSVTKPVTKSVTKPAAPTKLISVVAKEKIKKEKLVRDSFTMPESEYAALGLVKKACISAGVDVKKSQLLRIGLLLLSRTDVPSLKTLIANLSPLKAGRPKKDK